MKKIYIHAVLLFALAASFDSFASERRKKSCTIRTLCMLAGVFGIAVSGQAEPLAATIEFPRLSRLKVVCENQDHKKYCDHVARCVHNNTLARELARLKDEDNNPAVYFESRRFDHGIVGWCGLGGSRYAPQLVDFVESDDE